MYKVKNMLSPPFIQEMFHHMGLGCVTRMGDKFVRPGVNKVYKGENSLRNFGPVVWNNMLPEKLKTCTSLAQLKNSIRSWIPKNCPCRLCKHYVQNLGYINVV